MRCGSIPRRVVSTSGSSGMGDKGTAERREILAWLEAGGWRLEAGGWRLEAGGWRLEAGGWRLEAGGWRLEAGGWTVCGFAPDSRQAFSSRLPASSASIGFYPTPISRMLSLSETKSYSDSPTYSSTSWAIACHSRSSAWSPMTLWLAQMSSAILR